MVLRLPSPHVKVFISGHIHQTYEIGRVTQVLVEIEIDGHEGFEGSRGEAWVAREARREQGSRAAPKGSSPCQIQRGRMTLVLAPTSELGCTMYISS